jgi:hypothetical protein
MIVKSGNPGLLESVCLKSRCGVSSHERPRATSRVTWSRWPVPSVRLISPRGIETQRHAAYGGISRDKNNAKRRATLVLYATGRLTGSTLITMRDLQSVRSAERSASPRPLPGALRVARLLFWIQSSVWMLLGVLLVVGGLNVLTGGNGLPGIVNDPVGDPPIGGWAVGSGIVITVIASWGIWTGWSMRRPTRAAYISALVFCGVWTVLGMVWVTIATTPIPGGVVMAMNAVILVGLVAPSSSRVAFLGRR